MKFLTFYCILAALFILQCSQPASEVNPPDYSSVSRVNSGKAVSVMLTAYSTTLRANGKDNTRLRIALTDSLSREIISAMDSIHVYVTGDAVVKDTMGQSLMIKKDSSGIEFAACKLTNGICFLQLYTGLNPDKIKVEARCAGVWPGAHEIHTIPGDVVLKKPRPDQLPQTTKQIDRMIGADISWLPEFEAKGRKFIEQNEQMDAIQLLKNHGFNTIRLRIFVNPENDKGYSPGVGFCGLDQTLLMAMRVKKAGMKLLLDFHYSDYWADPQQQYKPKAWAQLDFETLKDSLRAYTSSVLLSFDEQGTLPDMVQVGNEINHGLLWPEGHISQLDQLAELLVSGVEGIEAVAPEIPIMMHIALGGQIDEAIFWLDNMIARDVQFDIIGLSYYPRWHGTLEDLHHSLFELSNRYHKPLNVVEYNDFTKTVHDIVFSLPDDMGKGACIWEPLSRRSGLFNRDGSVRESMQVYDVLQTTYITN